MLYLEELEKTKGQTTKTRASRIKQGESQNVHRLYVYFLNGRFIEYEHYLSVYLNVLNAKSKATISKTSNNPILIKYPLISKRKALRNPLINH